MSQNHMQYLLLLGLDMLGLKCDWYLDVIFLGLGTVKVIS
jgi:hypothetical protein